MANNLNDVKSEAYIDIGNTTNVATSNVYVPQYDHTALS